MTPPVISEQAAIPSPMILPPRSASASPVCWCLAHHCPHLDQDLAAARLIPSGCPGCASVLSATVSQRHRCSPRTYQEESLLLIALLKTRLPTVLPGHA